MRVAEALSYLKVKDQETVEGLLASGKKISIKQADILKAKAEDGGLTKTSISELFKPGYFEAKVKPVKLSGKFLSAYFDETKSADEIEHVIAKALEKYYSKS
jgi:hypothetical protein